MTVPTEMIEAVKWCGSVGLTMLKVGDVVRATAACERVYCTAAKAFNLKPGMLAVVRDVEFCEGELNTVLLVDFEGREHRWGKPLDYWEVLPDEDR